MQVEIPWWKWIRCRHNQWGAQSICRPYRRVESPPNVLLEAIPWTSPINRKNNLLLTKWYFYLMVSKEVNRCQIRMGWGVGWHLQQMLQCNLKRIQWICVSKLFFVNCNSRICQLRYKLTSAHCNGSSINKNLQRREQDMQKIFKKVKIQIWITKM